MAKVIVLYDVCGHVKNDEYEGPHVGMHRTPDGGGTVTEYEDEKGFKVKRIHSYRNVWKMTWRPS